MYKETLGALGLFAGLALAGVTASQAAMPALPAPASAAPLTQQVQFLFNPFDLVFGGHEWCWYDDGWRGDGWYWCGYGYREGYGYGGGEGFHGWSEHRYERDWHGGGGEHRRHEGGDFQHRHHDDGQPHHDGGQPHHDGGQPHHDGGQQHHDGGQQHHEGGHQHQGAGGGNNGDQQIHRHQ